MRDSTSDRFVGEPIKLAATLSFTGKYRTNGIHVYNGYELTRRCVNASGGIRLGGANHELLIVYEDDESDATRAARLAERFITEDLVWGLLGPYSSELTRAVALVAERHKIPLVEGGGASTSLFARENDWIFGLLTPSDEYMRSFLRLAIEEYGERGKAPHELNLAITVQGDRFSLYVRKAIMRDALDSGVQTIDAGWLPSEPGETARAMLEALEKVQSFRPDIFIVSGHSLGARALAEHIGSIIYRPPMIGLTHCEAAGLARDYARQAEGIYCTSQWEPGLDYRDSQTDPRDNLFGSAADFAQAMKAAYPMESYENVPYQAASAAAAVIVWRDALQRVGTRDPRLLRDSLSRVHIETFYGRICFSREGKVRGQIISKPMVLRQIRNGEFVPVQTRGNDRQVAGLAPICPEH